MSYRLNEQIAFKRPPSGPLVPWLGRFANRLTVMQFALSTIYFHLRLIIQFSAWLESEQIEIDSLSREDVTRYLHTKRNRRKYVRARTAIGHLTEYLQSDGVIFAATSPMSLPPIDRYLKDYELYLRTQKNLAEQSIKHYKRIADGFLRFCFSCKKDSDLAKLQFGDVITYVRQEAARLNSTKTKQLMTTGLRSFLRYVHVHADGMPDLAAQVPGVASWAMPSVPRGINSKQVDKLLTSVDRSTTKGRRDYAIFLLLARLGLRGIEIASLTLDDIDWLTATLRVTQKGGQRSHYPLTNEIGQAIADYIQNGRPTSDDRRVFLRMKAPIREFKHSSGIGAVVRGYLETVGIESTTKGTHQFRHGLATEMLRQSASLQEIGDLLGHRTHRTTMIYAKTDLTALHTIALPWPGDIR